TAVACPMPWPAPVMIETLLLGRMVFPDRWTVSAPLECGDSILFHCIAQPRSWQAQHGPLFPKRPIINNGLIAIARRPVQAAGAGPARRCDAMHEARGSCRRSAEGATRQAANARSPAAASRVPGSD